MENMPCTYSSVSIEKPTKKQLIKKNYMHESSTLKYRTDWPFIKLNKNLSASQKTKKHA